MNLSKPTPTTIYQPLSNYRDIQYLYQQYHGQKKSLTHSFYKLSSSQQLKAVIMEIGALWCLLGLIFFDNHIIKAIMMFAMLGLIFTTANTLKVFHHKRHRVGPITAKYLKSHGLTPDLLQPSPQISEAVYRQRIDFILTTPIPVEIWQNKTLTQLNLSLAQKADIEMGLKDFFLLKVVYPNRPTMMPSKLVDELWHAFILDTRRYQAYCEQAFGELFHHVPDYQFQDNQKNIERFTWQATCRIQGLEPRKPSDIPLLFVIDKVILHGMMVGSIAWLTYQQQMTEQYQLWQQKIFGNETNSGMLFEDNGVPANSYPTSSSKSHCDVDITQTGDCHCGGTADGSGGGASGADSGGSSSSSSCGSCGSSCGS